MENPFPADHLAHTTATLLLARTDVPIHPKQPYDAEVTQAIRALHRGHHISDLVASALHLLNDDLDSAHVLCQAHEGTPTADYLHQIVHRREGDFGNARYWLHRTGTHPLHATFTDARQMIDLCQQSDTEAATKNRNEMWELLCWIVAQGA
jgi:hypothetical protein